MNFGLGDGFALALFLGLWVFYNWFTDYGPWSQRGLSQAMRRQRQRWMKVLLLRDLRMIDTAIMTGLQQGTGFFASSCIFAIGGCFALLGSADRIAQISADLPFQEPLDRRLVEMKLLGLVVIFAYAFFKFAWSYRLFNYCSILIGAIPMRAEAQADPERAERAVRRAAELNALAAQHFNAGLRAIFFALAYLGWFLGPGFLVATTLLVLGIVGHRQFFSSARAAVIDGEDDEHGGDPR
ncbi:DUF599 domain-containing protein [Antarcticirhabdus aurantiaca]|uniref:DUF599 family protein n=1 Tax=Antarcticirhabdus aurantiaca TaxID=2606717 RepID=A0ACD4NVD9_9HYPH|nr:DUF599 family protein [Antarcticirhabdus aurantiaca]WAJ30855.1 DUF599 family protein [Jeongeuplla avenae]